jgi:hypothetical protein
MMTLVDLIADYTVLHLTAEYRHDLAEFVEAYLEDMFADLPPMFYDMSKVTTVDWSSAVPFRPRVEVLS